MRTITLYLEERQIEELDKLAERTGTQKSEHIRRAVSEYLDRQPNQKKDLPTEMSAGQS